ncbi:hypothetical protein H696_01487 [Fonticula alba]|uniref:AAA+ ATPase domain-containing protein n=1 Tax=Fonticula alba TaxID=691883 RepID=A0A058ZCH1_FONAL|nr:hypothetical protein H696_01487 [Fonticula alba]KCV72079.1 hypothetical protein H696_01487 [Fonticula alba]|eukprot:XP_009493657.1 hypothetical protein H696_01487 [Fonticula alba]
MGDTMARPYVPQESRPMDAAQVLPLRSLTLHLVGFDLSRAAWLPPDSSAVSGSHMQPGARVAGVPVGDRTQLDLEATRHLAGLSFLLAEVRLLELTALSQLGGVFIRQGTRLHLAGRAGVRVRVECRALVPLCADVPAADLRPWCAVVSSTAVYVEAPLGGLPSGFGAGPQGPAAAGAPRAPVSLARQDSLWLDAGAWLGRLCPGVFHGQGGALAAVTGYCSGSLAGVPGSPAPGPVLVSGPAGCGKTSLCVWAGSGAGAKGAEPEGDACGSGSHAAAPRRVMLLSPWDSPDRLVGQLTRLAGWLAAVGPGSSAVRATLVLDNLDGSDLAPAPGARSPLPAILFGFVNRLLTTHGPALQVLGACRDPARVPASLARLFETSVAVPPLTDAARRAIGVALAQWAPLRGVCLEVRQPADPAAIGAFVAAELRSHAVADVLAVFRQALLHHDGALPPAAGAYQVASLSAAGRAGSSSSTRELFTLVEPGTASWADLGGVDLLRQRLEEAIVQPMLHAPGQGSLSPLAALAYSSGMGVVLHGPPGTGKTHLARAAAAAAGASIISLSAASMARAHVGELEASVRQVLAAAREAAPCIVLVDEIDALVGRADAGAEDAGAPGDELLLASLLAELDQLADVAASVRIIATTNHLPWLDARLLRPGRLDVQLEVPLPDHAARMEIIELLLRKIPLAAGLDLSLEFLWSLADQCEGFSGAELVNLTRQATNAALSRLLSQEQDTPDGGADEEIAIHAADIEAALSSLVAARPGPPGHCWPAEPAYDESPSTDDTPTGASSAGDTPAVPEQPFVFRPLASAEPTGAGASMQPAHGGTANGPPVALPSVGPAADRRASDTDTTPPPAAPFVFKPLGR